MRLQNKIALVTGASRGIGSIVARDLAAEGAITCLCGRNTDRLRALQLEIFSRGGKAVFEQIDISDESQVESLASFCKENFGKIDVFVHTAMVGGSRVPFHLYPIPEWKKVIDTTMTGFLLLIKNIVPLMTLNGGSIINVMSTSANTIRINTGIQGLINSIMDSWTPLLAAELRTYNIRVNAIDIWSKRQSKNLDGTQHEFTEPFIYLACRESQDTTGKVIEAESFRKDITP